jgi:hypothetical protein
MSKEDQSQLVTFEATQDLAWLIEKRASELKLSVESYLLLLLQMDLDWREGKN